MVEVPAVREVMVVVVNVPCPNESSRSVEPMYKFPPIEKLPVEVPMVKVVFASELEVFTVRTVIVEVVNDA